MHRFGTLTLSGRSRLCTLTMGRHRRSKGREPRGLGQVCPRPRRLREKPSGLVFLYHVDDRSETVPSARLGNGYRQIGYGCTESCNVVASVIPQLGHGESGTAVPVAVPIGGSRAGKRRCTDRRSLTCKCRGSQTAGSEYMLSVGADIVDQGAVSRCCYRENEIVSKADTRNERASRQTPVVNRHKARVGNQTGLTDHDYRS